MIQDSGDRREFESGAVRDMAEGKGRCDLMPLYEVGVLLSEGDYNEIFKCFKSLYSCLDEKKSTCERYAYALDAIRQFSIITGSTITNLMLEVAVHYEEGAKKYGERNWEKGLPAWCFIDSAVRHLLKYLDGRTDERHDRAFVWNMLGFAYTIEKSDRIEEREKNNGIS